ncbi:PYLa/PGLa B-like [Xenopus laevis]|uniref:PYLa/PGLa B-like n=1 Tax=Xenopus laevis TaxID=8355 RepID=A0A8J1KZ55_XENLA|nr:PYLa/PGLa B precursor [Xenopus laevis]
MYKQIFLCLIIAALCATIMAEASALADADEDDDKRYVRGMASKAGAIAGKIAKVALKALGRRDS